jgi:hypothetical protein
VGETVKRVAALALVAVAVAVAAGCGGKGDPRTPYAKSLDTLCAQTRKQIEALGQDPSRQVAAMPARYRIGMDFVRQLRKLHPSAGERAAAKKLVATYAWYWGSQQDAYLMFQAGNYNDYVSYQTFFAKYQKQAEAMASALGARQCARQPFSK